MSDTKITLAEAMVKLKEKVELFFSSTPSPDPIVTTEQKFTDAKLNDGTTIIRYADPVLATGTVVNVVDETGAEMLLPVGDYILEDGTTFTIVDEMGKADNVVLAPEGETEPDSAATPAMPMSDKPDTSNAPAPVSSAPKRVIKSQVEEHVFSLEIEGIEPISVDFSSMFKKLEDENKKLKELNQEMFSVIEKLSDMPASEPTESKRKFSVSEANKNFKESLSALEIKMSKENI